MEKKLYGFRLTVGVHQRLKVLCAKEKMSMNELLDYLLIFYWKEPSVKEVPLEAYDRAFREQHDDAFYGGKVDDL